MESGKLIYNSTIKRQVVDIYGVNSEIFKNMTKGEKISRLVKLSYKSKSVNRFRIGDKKKLFELCKQFEEKFEKTDTDGCGL